jgi:hypothetical protein
VDENVLAGLALDESKSLAGIEPLHCSLFSHLFTHFSFISYLCFSTASSRKAKALASLQLAAPLTNLKVLREQQTQPYPNIFLYNCLTKSSAATLKSEPLIAAAAAALGFS